MSITITIFVGHCGTFYGPKWRSWRARAHFNPRLTARAKISLSRAQNIFMPTKVNSIVL